MGGPRVSEGQLRRRLMQGRLVRAVGANAHVPSLGATEMCIPLASATPAHQQSCPQPAHPPAGPLTFCTPDT
jgi:hypothetical protein